MEGSGKRLSQKKYLEGEKKNLAALYELSCAADRKISFS